MQPLSVNQSHDIFDVRAEIYCWGEQVSAVADSRERGGKNLVTLGAKQGRNASPAPSAVPCTVNENESRHVHNLTFLPCRKRGLRVL